MQRIILFILCTSLSFTAFCQQKVVKVIDGSTSTPIAWVNVQGGNGYGTATNSEGEFVLKDGYRGTLVLSSLGYEAKTVDVDSLQSMILLNPISYSIAEATIKGMTADSLIRLLYVKYADLMLNSSHDTSTYFYRQITANKGDVKELQETFLSTNAGIKINRFGLLYGRYAGGDSDEGITHRNFHAFTSIAPVGNEGEQGSVWTAPICLDYADFYKVSLKVMTDGDKGLYVLSFKEQGLNSRPVIVGALTVDAETLYPVKFEGQIHHFKYRNALTRNQCPTFSIQYSEKEGRPIIKSMSVSDRYVTRKAYQYKDDMMRTYEVTVDVASSLYDVSENMPKELATATVISGDDYMIETIKTLPYDSTFWADNPIIKRTGLQENAIQEFETDESFGKKQTEQLVKEEEKTKGKSVEGVISKVKHFSQLYPQEKVYLHFDNTGYFIGETIWYKAYIVQTVPGVRSEEAELRSGYKPTTLSKVLYVELLTPGGDVLETQKLHIDENGGAHGQFAIDSILVSGFYEVRAYTRYMLNWGTNAVFSRVFPVFVKPERYGDYSTPTIKRTRYKDRQPNVRYADSLYLAGALEGIYTDDVPKKLSAHFYPEGGDLVSGLRSRVAVLVTDDNGSTYKGHGQIINASGKTVCSVETDSTGRGLFELTPTGEKLYLSMTNPTQKVQKIELPEVKLEGTVMNLDVVSDEISVTLRSQGDIIGQPIGYAIMHNGTIIACDTMQATPLIELSLMRETMPEGVNQLTIFSEGGRILSERLFFICPKPDKQDSITVTALSKGLGPVSEVELSVHTQPNTTFSFSALDYGSMTGGRQGNAKTWMLLSSDVKGYIADIEYYFEADDEQHRKDADLLMMIQGWRRYDWNLMCGNRWFENVQPIEDQLYLHGKLHEYRKKNPVGNVEVDTYLFNSHGQSLHGTAITDSLGNYALKLPDIDSEWNLQIFTKINDKRKTFYVGIDRQFSPVPRFITPDETQMIQRNKANLFADDNVDANVDDDVDGLKYADKVHVIPEVTVKARKYFTSDDNIQWFSERTGRHWATVYYNAQKELDKILDRGEPIPTVFEFLAMINPLFGNKGCADLPTLVQSYNIPILLTEPVDTVYRAVQQWTGGMTYGGRKIRWIIDNGLGYAKSDRNQFLFMDSATVHLQTVYDKRQEQFASMAQRPEYSYEKLSVNVTELTKGSSFSGVLDFPIQMDEIKSIHIVPDDKTEEGTVNIYIYRNHTFTSESQKGLRRTHFQGYNIPETFKMEDLSVLPPLENLRRTLYWNPDITTDSQGNALVKFYNNLSAKAIYFSAEGVAKDGRIMISK